MDMDFMNFKDEEYFSTFEQSGFLDSGPEDSTSVDDTNDNANWEWEQEREINGDIALIPISSNFDTDMSNMSVSPPFREDFHKLFCDWQNVIAVDGPVDDDNNHDTLTNANLNTFDITSFLTEPEPQETSDNVTSKPTEVAKQQPKKLRTGGKKIDINARKYIVSDSEDDHIDVETVSEHGDSAPVLEAGDLNSLLEQFEASEGFQSKEMASEIKVEEMLIDENIKIKQEVAETFEVNTMQLPTARIKIEGNSIKDDQVQIKKEIKPKVESMPQPEPASDVVKSKQILDALPEELIKKIKESGKRKPISVIPAIPNKKRCVQRIPETNTLNKIKAASPNAVRLDHDYCSSLSPYPKHPKKDSGFESSEEDERAIIRNQPTIKNADGKLMVSLLKVNTIKPNNVAEGNQQQKRKLNLAEYKKRRAVTSAGNSQCNSPMNSGRNSPEVEDENVRRQKHQEKLTRMAMELLNTPAKSSKNSAPSDVAAVVPPKKIITVPPDMEKKTLVSIGVNTMTIGRLPLCAAPVVEEIKPLLQNAKISTNSLITAVIESIPKVKYKNALTVENVQHHQQAAVDQEHGENKTIVYLPKNRKLPSTCSVHVQTTDFLTEENVKIKTEPRSDSSASSHSSRRSRHHRRRSSSRSSRYSSSSYTSSSSRSSSRSRSRSISPWYPRKQRSVDRDRLQEVEERRVVYVGRISYSTTREDLRRRFQRFGPITSVSVHFREHGDNYGFVTFLNKLDAYEAMEHGNDDPFYPKYDLSFGGRRMFCRTSYSDLDNMHEDIGCYPAEEAEDSFDNLLRKAQEQIRKRKL